jgi:hypothetical protein
MESISVILQRHNLSQYVGPLLEVGADDVEQLASLPEQDFQNLLEIIGMSKKLFHVLRFKKAINRSDADHVPELPVNKRKPGLLNSLWP